MGMYYEMITCVRGTAHYLQALSWSVRLYLQPLINLFISDLSSSTHVSLLDHVKLHQNTSSQKLYYIKYNACRQVS